MIRRRRRLGGEGLENYPAMTGRFCRIARFVRPKQKRLQFFIIKREIDQRIARWRRAVLIRRFALRLFDIAYKLGSIEF